MTKHYKFLNLKRGKIVSASGNQKWKLGEWVKHDGKLEMCSSGLHSSPTVYQALSYVPGSVLSQVEVKGKSLKDKDKWCSSEMRIIRAWKWQKKDSMALAIFAAESVLKNFEKKYPDDKRPREAIEAAKKVLASDTAKNREAASSASSAASSAYAAYASSAYAASAASSAASSASYAASAASSASSSASAASYASSAAYAASYAASYASALIKRVDRWMTDHIKELGEIKS